MTDAKAVRVLQEICCPETWVVARADNILHNAPVEAIIHDQ